MIAVDGYLTSHMLVAKRVEAAVAGTARFGLSAIAVESDEEMAALDVPVDYLMILSDKTNQSQAAAFALAARMESEGKRAAVHVPRAVYTWAGLGLECERF